MALKRARRQHLVLVSLVTLTAVAFAGGSLTFASMQAQALQEWVDEGAKLSTRIAIRTHELQRLQAALAGAQDKLGDNRQISQSMPGLELRLMEPKSDSYRATTGSNVTPGSSISSLPRGLVDSNLGVLPFLWDDAGAQVLEYCERGRMGRIACSAMPLESFIARAAEVTSLEIRYQVKVGENSTTVTSTPKWDSADEQFESAATFDFQDVQLALLARPADTLKASYRVLEWRYAAAATLVIYLIAMASLFARRKLILRQHALENTVERTRLEGEDMVRASLRVTASSADVLVWHLHDDHRLELFGPWGTLAGIETSENSLDTVLSHFVDAEAIKVSMLEALRKGAPWSRILVARLDGELITLQSNSRPVLGLAGQPVGMLGVATDITQALKAQAEISRGTTAHHAQVNYLRNMTTQMGAAALRLTTSVRAVLQDPYVLKNAELQRRLSIAHTEGSRVTDIAMNSLELMGLRSSKIRLHRSPMSVDELVLEAVRMVESASANLRSQQVVVADLRQSPERMVLTHKASLLTMLNIVLSNASKYTPKGSSIHVRLVSTGEHLQIRIEDNGPGVTKEELPRLAEPFFRGSSSVGTLGSGLGIATLMELASHTESQVQFAHSKYPSYGLLVIISIPWAQ